MPRTLRSQPVNPGAAFSAYDSTGLRSLSQSDLVWAYQLLCRYPERWVRIARNGIPTYPQFCQRFWGPVVAAFAVSEACPPEPASPPTLLALTDLNAASGTVWYERTYSGEGPPAGLAEASDQVLDLAFQCWPLRKVYAQYPECEPSPFGCTDGTAQEGRLRNATIVDGRPYDLIYESYSR